MKKLNHFLFAALAAGTVQMADAMNYQAQHLLLVFRDGNRDVEFDLGSVSQFIGLAAGTRVSVSYDQNMVTTNFGTMSGVDFLLVGATASWLGPDPNAKVWLTDSQLFSAPNNPTYSAFSVMNSKIEGVGLAATDVTASNSAPFATSSSDVSSYDKIVSDRTGIAIPTMYGSVPFAVENANPTTLAFYQLTWNNSGTPSSATLIGAFTIDVNGSLYFTAGQLPTLSQSQITGFTSEAGFNTISFTTATGSNYKLLYSSSLSSGWTPVAGGTSAGDGTVQNLFDFSQDPARFYRIQATY
jgi:hypothetical protein